ncbi:MAG: Zn-ribbon containing protein [Halodesulfurarchaeum sp.]
MPHECTNCGQTFPDGSKEMLSGCPRCGGNKFQYRPTDGQSGRHETESPEPPEQPGASGGVSETVANAATTVEEYVNQRRNKEEERTQLDQSSERGPVEERAAQPSETQATDVPTEDESATEKPEPEEDGQTNDQSDAAAKSGFGFDDGVELSKEDTEEEDTAQASARSGFADEDDLMATSEESSPDREKPEPPTEGTVVKEPTTDETPDLETLRSELNDQFESIKIVEPGQYELNLMELYDRQEYIISLQEDGKYVVEIPERWREGKNDGHP